ncbi:lysozyme [Methylorubrum sp. B1-46]|uniref:lysozyme n=1 Tax=Methylorubrum TaxID=2282523 RepID=UPI001E31DB28|nr:MULTISPECIES: lysozyme [Methylorubrum]MCG5246868.1 lysozyme [Methylorubrum extorquens]UGB24770.1 lysozyme [Methylorubrum sp. B1-46]
MLAFLRKLGVAFAVGTANAAPRAAAPVPVAVTGKASGRRPSRILLVPAAAAACTGLVGGFEALRTTAYRDIVGVPTICWGETQGVRMGMTKTVAERNSIFARRLDEFASHVERCVPSAVSMPVERYAAHVSLAYNIGWAGYCASSVARLQNSGDVRGACDAFRSFNKVGKGKPPNRVLVVSNGLTRRRAEERALCLKGA